MSYLKVSLGIFIALSAILSKAPEFPEPNLATSQRKKKVNRKKIQQYIKK